MITLWAQFRESLSWIDVSLRVGLGVLFFFPVWKKIEMKPSLKMEPRFSTLPTGVSYVFWKLYEICHEETSVAWWSRFFSCSASHWEAVFQCHRWLHVTWINKHSVGECRHSVDKAIEILNTKTWNNIWDSQPQLAAQSLQLCRKQSMHEQ